MTIRDLSDRILVKQKNEYDPPGDPFPYQAWKALLNQIIPGEYDEDFDSVFWQRIRPEFNLIASAFFARTLIALGEKNLKIRARSDQAVKDRMENDDRVDDLIWEEIKKLLSFK